MTFIKTKGYMILYPFMIFLCTIPFLFAQTNVSPEPMDTSVTTAKPTPVPVVPKIAIDQVSFQGEPLMEGSYLTHDFKITNEGGGVLEISKVKTG